MGSDFEVALPKLSIFYSTFSKFLVASNHMLANKSHELLISRNECSRGLNLYVLYEHDVVHVYVQYVRDKVHDKSGIMIVSLKSTKIKQRFSRMFHK